MALDDTTGIAAEAPVEASPETTPIAQPNIEDIPLRSNEIESGHMPVPVKEAEVAEDAEVNVAGDDETAVSDENPPVEPARDPLTEDPDNKTDEKAVEKAPETVVFDIEAEDFKDKITETLDKYDLDATPELKAVFDALQARADAVPVPPDTAVIKELADFGTPDVIKTVLERDNLLHSVVETPTGLRPKTNEYVATLPQATKDWLTYDLLAEPSTVYQGYTRFEEKQAESVAVPGDTIGQALDRYNQLKTIVQSGVIPESDVPAYIVERGPQIVNAYRQLPADSRKEYDLYAPEYDRSPDGIDPDTGDAYQTDMYGQPIPVDDAATRNRKLIELAKIARGFEADRLQNEKTLQSHQEREQQFNYAVQSTEHQFFGGMRDLFLENVTRDVVFSTDPKAQAMMAAQNVALLTQAFDEGSDGEFARQALADSGITFDAVKAEQLVRDVNSAAVALNIARGTVDADGKQLNAVALNQATRHFKEVGQAWQEFADNIIKQEQKITSTSKAEDVKDAVAKIKVAAKARPVVKQSPTPANAQTQKPIYGTPEYYDRLGDMGVAEIEARKARTYQNAA